MNISKITLLLLHLAISLSCSLRLHAQESSRAQSNSSQLTESSEVRANEIQPPQLVMDILGILPGMIIGKVGAGHSRLTVHLAARVGYIVFEHVIQKPQDPFPPGVHALDPGELRELFKDFDIQIYREVEDYGDWGGLPTPHVRMVARKSR